jgi:carboxyl-terminal processing protease
MKLPINMPKINLPKVKRCLLVALVSILLFSGGYWLGREGFKAEVKNLNRIQVSRELPPDKSTLDFSLFWRMWDKLSAKYYDKTKLVPGKMIYGAIQGMVAALGDPYTVFLPPTENKMINDDLKGSFEGVGIEIGYRGTQLAVISPLPGTPAEKAGVKPGDYIIGIKDDSKEIDQGTSGVSLPEAVQMIRGKAGTKVTLTFLRDGTTDPIVKEITREKINVPSVILSYVGNDKSIAHIKVMKFGAETDGEWNKAVKEVSDNPAVKGLVLDLRNNPGGYLQGAVDLAAEFLKNGSVVVSEERGDGTKRDFKTDRFGLFNDLPTVVLVNGGSASASEILSGALRDQRGIKLVGEKTFGKGTIQEPEDLENGAGIHITIAKWLTPSGTWVNGNGLEPDVKIENDPKTTEDEQLQKAIEVLSIK